MRESSPSIEAENELNFSNTRTVEPVDEQSDTQTSCWPKYWLPRSIPNVRVISVEYDTQFSDWASVCPLLPETIRNRTLRKKASSLLSKLHTAGVGRRPTIFVTHSMGGLIVKCLLVGSSNSPVYRELAEHTRGVVFYSTPHFGSPVADQVFSKLRYIIFPSVEVDELRSNSPYLLKLHSRFSKLKNIKSFSLGELKATNITWAINAVIVPVESSNPGLGVYEEYDTDHTSICKPTSFKDERYMKVIEFIKTIVEDTK
ncbi:protein SERAC1-like [Zophobas morio]|uniref:protein SERAC1-like n=1 Tax=Zophobas morio TaxID=2755281 RepID=UPI0030833A7D